MCTGWLPDDDCCMRVVEGGSECQKKIIDWSFWASFSKNLAILRMHVKNNASSIPLSFFFLF